MRSRQAEPKQKPPTKKYKQSQILELGVTASNGTSLALIYAFRQFIPKVFMALGRQILLPFNAAANLIRGILALYEAHQEGYKRPAVIRAVIAVVTGIGVATALIGGLVATAVFALAGPILSMVSFSIRAGYNGICAVYYGWLSYCSTDPVEKQKYKDKAITNAVNAVAAALNAIAIGLVLVALKASWGVLGIASGAITALFCFYKLATLKPVASEAPSKTASGEREVASPLVIAKKLALKIIITKEKSDLLREPKSAPPSFFRSPRPTVAVSSPSSATVRLSI